MSKSSHAKASEKKTILVTFIVAIILALVAGGFAVAFSVMQVTENNTTEFQAFVVSHKTYSSPRVFIVQVEIEGFYPMLHLYQSRGVDLTLLHHIRKGVEINFRIRNRDVARFKNGTVDHVEAVVFELWGVVERSTIEIEEGVYEDHVIWAFLVMSSLENFNQEYRVYLIVAPSVFGGKALFFFAISMALFFKHRVSTKIKETNGIV